MGKEINTMNGIVRNFVIDEHVSAYLDKVLSSDELTGDFLMKICEGDVNNLITICIVIRNYSKVIIDEAEIDNPELVNKYKFMIYQMDSLISYLKEIQN